MPTCARFLFFWSAQGPRHLSAQPVIREVMALSPVSGRRVQILQPNEPDPKEDYVDNRIG